LAQASRRCSLPRGRCRAPRSAHAMTASAARPPLATPLAPPGSARQPLAPLRSTSRGPRPLPGMDGFASGAAASAGRSLVGVSSRDSSSREPSLGKREPPPRDLSQDPLSRERAPTAASSREPSLSKRGPNDDALEDLLRAPPPVPSRGPEQRVQGAGGARPGTPRRQGVESAGGAGGAGVQNLDFDEEARKLWARLNLEPSNAQQGVHHALDALWRHPVSGGTFYVGNQTAAKRLPLLQQHGITHVVNCTDSMPLYHENAKGSPITYLRFDVADHMMRGHRDSEAVALAQPMLDFVGAALADGKHVMAHCLAGAHRAGTTGIICLMHFAQLPRTDAIAAAKRLRPIIDPIGSFPELLMKLERGWKAAGGT